jgi:hypothetical protein
VRSEPSGFLIQNAFVVVVAEFAGTERKKDLSDI